MFYDAAVAEGGGQVEQLAKGFAELVASHAVPREPVALVGFPNYPNVGDSAIWLGQRAALEAAGARLAFVCETSAYNPEALRRVVPPGGTVFIQGGGNFGDAWPWQQDLRESVIATLPDRKIVQLPQSLHFKDPARLEQARGVIDSHPDVTLMWRDRSSHAAASSAFTARHELSPDAAFGLGALRRPAQPSLGTLWLSRTDTEREGERLAPSSSADAVMADWLEEDRAYRLMRAANAEVLSRFLRRPRLGARVGPVARPVYDRVARNRLDTGTRLLASAEHVVTDRLHGHILCLLMGIPHTVIDTGHGKITDFLDTWTGENELVSVLTAEQA